MRRLALGFVFAWGLVGFQAASPACQTVVSFRFYPGDMDDLIGGYCLQDESGSVYPIPGLITWGTYQMPAPIHFTTRALWQNEGVIELSADYHNIPLEDVFDGVALMSPADVGKTVWVRRDGGEWIATRSADAVSREHGYYHIVYAESGIELGYELAVYYGLLEQTSHAGLYGLEVCVAEHWSVCDGIPVTDYTDWWLSTVRYVGN